MALASTSAYRKALLERLGVAFDVVAPDVDESPLALEKPEETALRLAELKARAGATKLGEDTRVIIGSDQVAVMDGIRLDKPGAYEAAVAQLTAVRGKRVLFHTAVCVYSMASQRSRLVNVPTAVKFRDLSDGQIERYLHREQPYDCAGSAKIEGLGIALVEEVVSDDPTALIGLPLIALVSMLGKEGIAIV